VDDETVSRRSEVRPGPGPPSCPKREADPLTMRIVRKLLALLTPQERRGLYVLFAAVVVMATLEVVSVASIMPFLSVASDPATVQENQYLAWAFETFGFGGVDSFLIFLGVGCLLALVLSNAFIVFTSWAMERFVWDRTHSLSRRLLRSYLSRSYSFFLTRNTAELGKNILEEVTEVAARMLKPFLRGVAKSIVAVFILLFLVVVKPIVALVTAVVLGAAYGAIYRFVRNRLDEAGTERVDANSERFKVVNEALSGIKEIKLRGAEEAFLAQYDGPSRAYAKHQTLYRVIRRVPRYVLEVFAFGAIIVVAIYLLGAGESVQQIIPILGLYVFAGYRLMPALQQAFRGLASARYNVAALETLERDMRGTAAPGVGQAGETGEKAAGSRLDLEDELVMDDITYSYPEADRAALRHVTVSVPYNSVVGFVGKTGSGKTTAIDLILGLLEPDEGEVRVDGTPLGESNLGRWQRSVGYVPQDIYLTDDTIARNIAFGVPDGEIDMESVRQAADRAHIREFVETDLPDAWSSVVGERGTKLSGGQKQRIGIARALYHDPSLLVFDEATSALDKETEAKIMRTLYGLQRSHTIIMISHRLETVRNADRVVLLEDGEKAAEGSFDDVMEQSRSFESMVSS